MPRRRIGGAGNTLALIDADPLGSALAWSAPGKLEFPVLAYPVQLGQGSDWAKSISKLEADFIVIDCAPNGDSIEAAAELADIVILPCGPSGLDIEGSVRAMDVVNSVRAKRRRPLPVLVVPTRVDFRTLEGLQVADELFLLDEPLGTPLGSRVDFVRAFAVGQSINTFAPGSDADREVRALTNEVLQSLRMPRRTSVGPVKAGDPTEKRPRLDGVRVLELAASFDLRNIVCNIVFQWRSPRLGSNSLRQKVLKQPGR